MKRFSQLASLLATLAFCSTPAMAQEFLNPVVPSPPSPVASSPVSWLEAAEVAAEVGNRNHSNNTLTGPGALNAGVVNGRQFTLPTAGNGLMAPQSVNNAPFPSGTYTDGFTGTQSDPTGSLNNYGMYAGQQLPLTATSSCDINVVDSPYTISNYTGNQSTNPYGLNSVLQTINANGQNNVTLFQSSGSNVSNFMSAGLGL